MQRSIGEICTRVRCDSFSAWPWWCLPPDAREPPDEVQIRSSIETMRSAAEARQTAGVIGEIADDFTGNNGEIDRDGLSRLLKFQFLRNESIGVAIGAIDVEVDGDRATAKFACHVQRCARGAGFRAGARPMPSSAAGDAKAAAGFVTTRAGRSRTSVARTRCSEPRRSASMRRRDGAELPSLDWNAPMSGCFGRGGARPCGELAQHVRQDAAVAIELAFLRRQQHHADDEPLLGATVAACDHGRFASVGLGQSGDRVGFLAGEAVRSSRSRRRGTAAAARPCRRGSSDGCARSSRR